MAALWLAMALGGLAAGCGSDDGDPAGPTTGLTVAPVDFDGVYAVAELHLGGADEIPLGPLVFDLDHEFGALSIETDCGTLLGAFTLQAGGEAHFSVTGRSVVTCAEDTRAQVGRLDASLANVDSWVNNDYGFDLRTPSGDRISLLG